MRLNYSSGIKTFEVDGGTISFSPTDTKFAERLYTTFDRLAKMQEDGEKKNAELEGDGEALFNAIHAKESEMQSAIDSVFGEGASKKIFPEVGLYAVADGMPVWANFLFAVMEVVEDAMGDEHKKSESRMELIKKKYGKYMK